MIFPKGTHLPPQRPRRRRKSVPCRNRLLCLLLSLVERSAAVWKPCPSYAKLAKCFKKSEGAINRAFRALEQWEDCPLAFRSGYTGEGNTRQKLFAVKDNLLFDEEPLFRRRDGRSRGIRESFRRDAEPAEATVLNEDEFAPGPPPVPAQSAPETERETKQNDDTPKPESYCRFCFILESRLSSADKAPPPSPLLPPAELSGEVREETRTLNAQAWRLAREALRDGELFYDNRKPRMPLPSLRTLIQPALERGLDWRGVIRPALLHALRQAHDAAVLSAEVRNPGGMAAVIFRERLGLGPAGRIRPSRRRPDHPPAAAPRKTGDVWASPPPVKPPSPPAAPPVDREAVRAQAGMLAAMMRAALVQSR